MLQKMKWSCLHGCFMILCFPRLKPPVSLGEMKATLSLHPAGEANTVSKRSELLQCHSRTAAFSVPVHVETFTKGTGQSCYAAQAQPGKQERSGLTPRSGSFPTTVGNQPPKGHRLLPCLSSPPPSLTPLQGVLHMP